jgi:hypothetical protein
MEADELEARTQEQIKVRQVTHVQVSWTEVERAAPGAFTIQLILDHGAEEYVLRPAPEDAELLLQLFEKSGGATFDVERTGTNQEGGERAAYAHRQCG